MLTKADNIVAMRNRSSIALLSVKTSSVCAALNAETLVPDRGNPKVVVDALSAHENLVLLNVPQVVSVAKSEASVIFDRFLFAIAAADWIKAVVAKIVRLDDILNELGACLCSLFVLDGSQLRSYVSFLCLKGQSVASDDALLF